MLSALNIAGPIWLNNFYTEQLKMRVNVKYLNCVYLLGHQLNVTPTPTRRHKIADKSKTNLVQEKEE